MKLSTIYPFFFVLLFAVIMMSNRSGRAGGQGWGNTGAPGDETLGNGSPRTCLSCHNTTSTIQVSLDIMITDDSGASVIDDGYVPGETYDVKVTIDPAVGTPAGYGFQMIALNGDDNVNAAEVSTWSDLGNNVKSSIASNTSRTYVEHDDLSISNEFMMKWTAPANLSGPVTFYAAGNGVNNNRSTSGDGAAINKLTLSQSTTTSTTELTDNTLNIYPNPIIDQLSLETTFSGTYDLSIYDLSGRLVKQNIVNFQGAKANTQINLSELKSGMYYLHLANDQQQLTKKLLKQ